MSNEIPHAERPPVREPRVMLSDLTDDLLWPRILRAPALALGPSRLITGTVAAFLLAVLMRIVALFAPGDPTADPPHEPGPAVEALNGGGGGGAGRYDELLLAGERLSAIFANLLDAAMSLDPIAFARSIGYAAVTIRDTVMHQPLIAVVVGIPLIAILAIAGGAISRSAAIEFAHGRFASREDTLGFTLRRARQFVGAVIGPVIFCALLFLLIAVGGLLLSVPVLDLLGSILYLFGLALGILATVVLMLHVLALPLIVPALAVEGTDGFDAIQRSYAYVIGRPLRYLLYALILLLLGTIAAAVFAMVARISIDMTDAAALMFTNDAAERALSGEGEMGATKAYAYRIVEIWRTIVELIAAGYIISIFFTSSTLLYLVIRRVCDGQDINEVWEPVVTD
ncbi:MAG: hypothetical protein WD114_06225 [Phycisphaerales bacterium]